MKKALMPITICAVLFTIACTDKESQTTQEKFPVANPIVADTIYKQEYVADIQAIQNVEIRARVKGFLDKIHVDEGEAVQEGQILFTISSKEYQEELLKASAALKSAIAEVKAAEVELQSAKTLVEKNIVSKTEEEKAQANLEALKAKVDEAKANESNASLNLSYTVVKAPFSGVINRIPNKAGSLIDEGTLLTIISNNKEVFAYFNVSEKEYLEFVKSNSLNHGQEASLVLADNQPYSYKGIVETVESEINKSTGSLAFRARFRNPEQLLKHGSSGKIQLAKKITHALLIPQKSTFEIQENIYVYAVDDDNTVKMRRIIPSVCLPHLYVISSGLSVKDRFIYEGIQRVKEGDKITPETVQLSQISNF